MSLLEAQRQRHKALGQRHGLGASEVRWGISQACLISGYLWCIFLDFGSSSVRKPLHQLHSVVHPILKLRAMFNIAGCL